MNSGASLLEELRGIHLPPDPSLWPPAPGWWILAVAIVIVAWWALGMTRRALGRWQRRRGALRALAGLKARSKVEPDCALCADLSVLLRSCALRRFPRQEVASLTGAAWLRFLERSSGGEAAFTRAGQALLSAPYRSGGKADVDTLLRLAGIWIKRVL